MDYKQPFSNEASIEFKNLESKLLSAVSYFEHALKMGNKFIRLEGYGVQRRFASQTKPKWRYMYSVFRNQK